MKNNSIKYFFLLVIVVFIALAAWWNHFNQQNNSTSQSNVSFLDQIKNYAYDVSSEGLYFSKGMFGPQDNNYNPNSVQLTNGLYQSGPYHNTYVSGCTSDTTHSISLATDSSGNPLYASGDLNGDGKDDAVVMLNLEYKEYNKKGLQSYCNGQSEDSSRLMLIALINNNGKLEQKDSYMWGETNISTISTASDLSNITIKDGIIVINAKNAEEYKIVNGKIVIAGKSFQAPNLPQDLKNYTNNDFGFSFQYPGNLNFTTENVQPPTLFEMQIGSISTEESAFAVTVNAEDFSSCIGAVPPEDGLATELMINGIPFYKTTGSDAAMGTYSTMIQYSAFKNGKCYQIGLQYFTHRCDACSSGQNDAQSISVCNSCTQDNKSAEALSDIPDIVVSTFKFNQNMIQAPAPTCSIQTDKQSYKLGDVINLTWESQNTTGAFWNQLLETGGIRKNIVPPQVNPPMSGSASTVANIEGNQSIDLKVSGLGGIADCSASINVAHSDAMPSITINSGTISSTPNGAGNSDVILKGTATNGALYNDDINLVLFNANYSGPFDEETIYNQSLRSEWFSGGAAIELRQDNLPFENWSVKTYAPAGTTRVRVLAYPFYSSSTTSATQPLANIIITLTPTQ